MGNLFKIKTFKPEINKHLYSKTNENVSNLKKSNKINYNEKFILSIY